jgi:hypothetical protein
VNKIKVMKNLELKNTRILVCHDASSLSYEKLICFNLILCKNFKEMKISAFCPFKEILKHQPFVTVIIFVWDKQRTASASRHICLQHIGTQASHINLQSQPLPVDICLQYIGTQALPIKLQSQPLPADIYVCNILGHKHNISSCNHSLCQ